MILSEVINSCDSDPDFVPEDCDLLSESELRERNFLRYPILSMTASRYGLSNRATAAIANALLSDLKLLTKFSVLDPKKVERGKTRVGTMLDKILKQRMSKSIKVLAFDERCDKTLLKISKESEVSKGRTVVKSTDVWQCSSKEEHCPLLGFGSLDLHGVHGTYLTHLSPEEGNAEALSTAIFEAIKSYDSTESIIAILADGCNKNTGIHGGVIRKLEEKLGKPLGHLVCLYHLNELPFRHLFEFLDGGTSGPRSLKGQIGKLIEEDVTEQAIVNFKRVRGLVERPSQEIITSLSQDQKYLLEISLACQQGPTAFQDKPGLAKRSPGPLNHSRWLTRANRILRLYVSCIEPSPQLQRLVYILLNTYVPAWFFMKKSDGFVNGSACFHHIVSGFEKILNLEEQDVVEEVLSRNNFFGHPENVLMGMLFDSKSMRKKAVTAILEARKRREEIDDPLFIRKFRPLQIKMKAQNYVDLVDWKKTEDITEPPFTFQYSSEELKSHIDNPTIVKVPCAPFHTQSVERMIKLVTQVSSRVNGFVKRHHEILNTVQSRKMMPKFDSKIMFPLENKEP